MNPSPTSRARPGRGPARYGAVLVFCAAAGIAHAGSLLRGTHLCIGRDHAVVRERRTVIVPAGEGEFTLDGIPPEAELSSLVLRSRRVAVELLEWRREGPAAAGTGADPSLAVSADGSRVTWARGEGAPAAGAASSVRCRASSPVENRPMDVEVSYVLPGMGWSASYQVGVRGEEKGETEPVSVDLTGLVRIENCTSQAFEDATVLLVGAPGLPAPPKDPGFPMVDEESPLADLWRPMPPEPATEFEYALPDRVTVPARGGTDVVLVRTLRTPAARLYRMAAEDFPVGVEGKDAPLRKVLAVRNTAGNRMGMSLPPGKVQVFLGGMRTHLLQEAWFQRTPPNGEIRIDLGAAGDVRGLRVAGGRTPEVAGYFEQVFVLSLGNRLDAAIRAEVDEKPPLSLEWDIVSATKPYREEDRRLVFETEIGPRGQETIEYRLRIRRPGL